MIVLETKPPRTYGPLKAIEIGSSLPLKGQAVLAFGSPAGLTSSTSNGIVPAIRSGTQVRELFGNGIYESLGYDLEATWIQHTAATSRGNSGGPLVNMRGELIGLNTWSRPDGQNLNFAIGGPDIKQILNESDGMSPRNFSGLAIPRANFPDGKDAARTTKRPRQTMSHDKTDYQRGANPQRRNTRAGGN